MIDTRQRAGSKSPRSAVQSAMVFQAFARADLGGPAAYGRRFDDRAFAGAVNLPDGRQAWLALVADGVGGGPAGGHAADLAVEAVLARLTGQAVDDPVAALAEAVRAAHQAVQAAGRDVGRRGLASTLAAALVVERRLYVVNVGDSRIYLLQGARLTQVTDDHVWWRLAVAEGRAEADHARRHPRAEELARALGLDDDVEPDLGLYLRGGPLVGEDATAARDNQGLALQAGDRVLVCTDGLIKPRADRSGRATVSDAELRGQLEYGEAEAVVHTLIGLAHGRGADDNISAAVLAVAASAQAGPGWRPLLGPLLGPLFVGLVSALAASVTTAWWLGR